jgi:ankyrin repeat protein
MINKYIELKKAIEDINKEQIHEARKLIGSLDKSIFSTFDKDDRNLLHLAVVNNDYETAGLLIKKMLEIGADINIKDKNQETPLMLALAIGYFSMAQLLVREGADPLAKNQKGETAFEFCALRNYETMELLINKYFKPDNDPIWTEIWTKVIYIAACCGCVKVYKNLSEKGLKIDLGSEYGQFLLDSFHKYGRIDFLNELIKAQLSEVEVPDENLPLNKKLIDCIEKDQTYKLISILNAVTQEEVISFLKSKNENDCTPLHLAVMRGNFTLTKFFIEKGADINAKNKQHETPLFKASYRGYKELVSLLIERGANLEVKETKNGHTALQVAICKFHNKTAKLLIEKKANIDSLDKQLYTPCVNAILRCNSDMAELLIEKKANINFETVINLALSTARPLQKIINELIKKSCSEQMPLKKTKIDENGGSSLQIDNKDDNKDKIVDQKISDLEIANHNDNPDNLPGLNSDQSDCLAKNS